MTAATATIRHSVGAELTRTLTGQLVWVGACSTCPWVGAVQSREYLALQDAAEHALKRSGEHVRPVVTQQAPLF